MGNTIVSFLDKYYKYSVDPDPDRRGLTIGGFESAFLADLKATYIFDKLNHLLARHVHFIGTYQDDKIIVFCRKCSNEWLSNWLCTLQHKTDRLLGTMDIQFTMEIWSPGETTVTLPQSACTVPKIGTFNRVSINGNLSFPFLDVKISWDEEGRLTFDVHKKPGKLVKYLNHNSHHHCHHKTTVLSWVKL
jgi:hypothetical protein